MFSASKIGSCTVTCISLVRIVSRCMNYSSVENAVGLLAAVIAISPAIIGIGWAFVEGAVLPNLISRGEIDRLVDAMVQHYPEDPEKAAFLEEGDAWYRSEPFEQGKWHRIRKVIHRQMAAC